MFNHVRAKHKFFNLELPFCDVKCTFCAFESTMSSLKVTDEEAKARRTTYLLMP